MKATAESVRKRPAMYLGSTGERGLLHVALELVSNSVDQFLKGAATRIDVRVLDGILHVVDDGPGVPLEGSQADGRPVGPTVLIERHSTATADGHAPHVHLHGACGVGLAVLNAVSDELRIDAVRGGVHWSVACARGVVKQRTRLGDADWYGTRVSIRPDPSLFTTVEWPMVPLRERLRESAALFPGLRLSLNGEEFYEEDGLAGLLPEMASVAGGPVFRVSEQIGGVSVEVAACGPRRLQRGFRPGAPATVVSWCNGCRTDEHGTHVDGVLEAFAQTGWWPDVLLVSVVFGDATYAGPTRRFLNVPVLRGRLAGALVDDLRTFVSQHVPERL